MMSPGTVTWLGLLSACAARHLRAPQATLEHGGVDFVACDEPKRCDAALPSLWMGDLLRAADQPLLAAGRGPAMLHVGGAGFSGCVGGWIDANLYNGVNASGPVRFYLVEASPDKVEESTANLKKLNMNGSANVINALLMENCTGTHFYGVDKRRVKKDFGLEYFMSWESTSRSWVRSIVSHSANFTKRYPEYRNLPHDYDSRWQSWVDSPNFDSYIVELPTPCLTPSELLKKINVKPDELAMAVIDIEGADVGVMNNFLDIPGFHPPYLQLEAKPENNDTIDLMKKLHDHGYSVGQHDPHVDREKNLIGVWSARADSITRQ